MNRRTVLLIAASALLPAILSLWFSTAVFGIAWTILLVLWVWLLLRSDRVWADGLAGGLGAGLVTGLVQAAFVRVYFASHPADAEMLARLTDLGKAGYLLGFALVAGLAWGALAALIAWGVGKFRRASS